ncbi:GNAT family N-acetyltransferase [Sphaerisporangium perillae]|uniref:GNAT family N-acetyltransferase n=1 Tax=Sphaerisporangium perillae TaxID=2935860 RepID=UPI0027DF22BE|nr:GNAT family N-acetyltransferase [Sphaerisporangium perillae]
MGESIVRVAVDADMPGVREVASRFETLDDWTDMPDFLDAERAFGTLVVGEVDGRIVGFGGVLRRGQVSHLGDLYVLPDHQSSGVGRKILDRLLPTGTPRVTFASDDPRALGLYVRQGMRPVCPLLYLTSPPPEDSGSQGAEARGKEAPDEPAARGPVDGPRAEKGEPPGMREAGRLDARLTGGDRTGTLSWYAGLPGVTLHLTGRGYALARLVGEDLEVGPAGGETPQDCADAVLAAVGAHPGVEEVQVAVPGVHPLLPQLLEAGWEIDDMDTFMTTEPGPVWLDRYLPHPDLG